MICGNNYIENDVKVSNHCIINEKNWGYAHIYFDINLELNHKIPSYFTTKKKYDSHLIMQELGKFKLEISVVPNGL